MSVCLGACCAQALAVTRLCRRTGAIGGKSPLHTTVQYPKVAGDYPDLQRGQRGQPRTRNLALVPQVLGCSCGLCVGMNLEQRASKSGHNHKRSGQATMPSCMAILH